MKYPNWTVVTNIKPIAEGKDYYVGNSWEFFTHERDALTCYERHINSGNVPTKRPFYKKVDSEHLHVIDKREIEAEEIKQNG